MATVAVQKGFRPVSHPELIFCADTKNPVALTTGFVDTDSDITYSK